MTNMTAFEIRLELLKMAKEMLVDEYCTQKEIARDIWEATKDTTGKINPTYPPYPNERAIIEKAIVLNEFISNPMKREVWGNVNTDSLSIK